MELILSSGSKNIKPSWNLAPFCLSVLSKPRLLNKYGYFKEGSLPLQKLFHSIFPCVFLVSRLILCSTNFNQIIHFYFFLGKNIGLSALSNPSCPYDSFFLYWFWVLFWQGWWSVCTVSGVLTPPAKEERRKTIWLTWVEPNISFCDKI